MLSQRSACFSDALVALTDEQPATPRDIIESMVLEIIREQNLAQLAMPTYFKERGPRKKPKHMDYDRERAHWCVIDN